MKLAKDIFLPSVKDVTDIPTKKALNEIIRILRDDHRDVFTDGLSVDATLTSALANIVILLVAKHTHSNKTTLDAIQEALTTALKGYYDDAVTKAHSKDNDADLDPIFEATFEKVVNKGAEDGYAGLDSDGEVPSAQLPFSLAPDNRQYVYVTNKI